jgi:GT2 family glycosyltransferase
VTPEARGLAFSVVIPTLGRIEQLHGCLAALARLDYPRDRFEVVIADDRGGDAVSEAVTRWEPELGATVVSTGGGAGAAAARNAGISAAEGRLIAFTDDDCAPEPGWLGSLERELDRHPGSAVGGRVVNGARGACAEGSQVVLDATHAHFNRDPAGPAFFATSNLAFPAEGLRAVGGFDESFFYAEDRELCERWRQRGRSFAFAPDAVVRHMRELTPLGLWRQHFGYGRGAWHFHRVRREHGWGPFEVEPGFYRELDNQVRRNGRDAGVPALGALALTSQVANAAGFASEALRARLASRRDPSR